MAISKSQRKPAVIETFVIEGRKGSAFREGAKGKPLWEQADD